MLEKQNKTIQKHSTSQLQKQKLPQIRDLIIGKAEGMGNTLTPLEATVVLLQKGNSMCYSMCYSIGN